MKKRLLILPLFVLAACQNGGQSSLPASSGNGDDGYAVKWVTPTGTPTLAFYDQGANTNWLSSGNPSMDVAPSFATDNFDAIVFDGYAGLKTVMTKNRNYQLARWLSEGT
ncbi:MAG: hypothetical protein J6038_03745, partial [Bacilli bacterium]|nr:hypothetical protein [Bacilli bacterium]